MTFLANVDQGGAPGVVALVDDLMVDCSDQLGARSIESALRLHRGELPDVDLEACPAVVKGEVSYRPLGDARSRYFCIGFNFASHAQEVERELPEHPTVFLRNHQSFVGHGQAIVAPAVSGQFDWEGEIGVVIARSGRHIPAHDVVHHVAGYTAIAENSVRDWQLHSTQATAGKNFDASGGIGPCLAPLTSLDQFRDLELETRLNGEAMQKGLAADHVFDLSDLVSYLSTFTELQPGDVIATGTPPGIGYRRNPQRFLADGDVLEVEVSGLPVLQNAVTQSRNS